MCAVFSLVFFSEPFVQKKLKPIYKVYCMAFTDQTQKQTMDPFSFAATALAMILGTVVGNLLCIWKQNCEASSRREYWRLER